MEEILLTLAKAGDGDAMEKLAFLRREQGQDEEYHKWLVDAAGAGRVKAMETLGNDFLSGRCCNEDIIQGIAWHKKAAELGSLVAAISLLNLWEQDKGASSDTRDLPGFLAEILRRECVEIYATHPLLRIRAFGSRREDEYLPLYERALEFRRLKNRLHKITERVGHHER